MFPKRFFPTRMFADRYFPQSAGTAPATPTDHYLLTLGVGH